MKHVISFLWIAPGHCQIVVGAQMFVDIGIQYIIYSMLNSILDLRPNNVRFVFGRKFFEYIGILIIKIVVCLNKGLDLRPIVFFFLLGRNTAY